MALWQYTFHLLPKQGVEILNPNLIFNQIDGDFDDEPYWKISTTNKGFFLPIAQILPKGNSWSKNIQIYGSDDSNCLEVFFEGDYVLSVSLRIDFTSNYESLLVEIIEFLLFNSLVILDENLIVLPLNVEGVKGVINNSAQVLKYKELVAANL